jgi:DMSO/TMAO reductase YedYZ molybdopterin-dependent catalytic subunit
MQTRRIFLYFAANSVGAVLAACGGEGGSGSTGDGEETGEESDSQASSGGGDETTGGDGECADPFAGGELLAVLPFIGESGLLGEKDGAGTGHDARLRLDLTTLTPETLITPNEDFYIRTELPDQLDTTQPWSINITGLVNSDYTLSLDELATMNEVSEVICMECSGNGPSSRFGLMSAAEFTGVRLMDVLELVDVEASATMVIVSGFDAHSYPSTHSTPGASWAFTFDQLAQAGAMLVTRMNGEPLSPDHGFPVRLMMPGWYGCCSAKWVDELRLVDDSEPATAQMQEFASRTHQPGIPSLCRDYLPATMDQAAMVTRVEKWMVEGAIRYRLVGIMWGGYETTDTLMLEVPGNGTSPVEVCPAHEQNRTWTLWSVPFDPPATGEYEMSLRIGDPGIVTRRLDTEYYSRRVLIDEL